MIFLFLDMRGQLDFSAPERQMPFVVAKALTLTAKDAQEAVRQHIRDTFVIRKKSGGFESSIAVRSATKTNLVSEVYTMAAFAALQQTGGIRKPLRGRLAIPDYSDIRQVSRHKPRMMGGLFEMRTKSGKEFLAERRGKDFKILYHLNKTAQVDKKLNMLETVIKTVGSNFAFRFNRAVKEL